MRIKLDGRFILICTVLSVSTFLKVSGQSQQYPPSFLSTDFIYHNWTIRDGLPVNSISSIVQHTDQYLWIGTADGLVRFDGVRFRIFNTSEFPELRNNRIRGLASLNSGLLILNSNMEFLLFKDLKFQLLVIPDFLKDVEILGIYKMGRTEVKIITLNAGTFIFEDGVFEKDKNSKVIFDKTRDVGAFSWQSYEESLFWEGNRLFDANDQINDAILDSEGSLWIATFSKGIYQIKRNLFETVSTPEGLPNRNVYPVTEDKSGTIWIGTHGNGIASLKNEILSTGYLFQGTSSTSFIQSILQRKNGDLLVAHLDGNIFKYSGEKIFLNYPSPNMGTINSLYESSDGRLWVGSSSGIYHQEKDKWERINNSENTNSSVKVIKEAPDGSMWVGSQGHGLLHIKNYEIEKIDKSFGLSSNSIRSIWIDEQNRGTYTVWAGTEDNGLNLIEIENSSATPLKAVSINVNDGLFDEVIHNIIPDEFGRIWMSSNKGIFWVYKNEILQFKRGNINEIVSSGYTEKDGLRSSEANGGIQPAGFKNQDGIIWFPTQEGIVKINPSLISRNDVIPAVYIEEVNTNESHYEPVEEKIKLKKGDRNISFRFTSLSYVSPGKNKFKFKLFNFEENWNEASGDRDIRYTNLDPGTYTFKVIASNNDGVWNQQGALVSISIPPYFYEASWFYALITGLIILQIILAFMIIKTRAQKILVLKEKKIQELEKDLTELGLHFQDHNSIKKALLFNLKKELKDPVLALRKQVELDREPVRNIVERETRNMLSQIDRLLLLSEIELNGIAINPTIENLVEVVKTSISIHKSEASHEDPDIEFSSNSETVKIYMDINFAIIIFRNLIKEMVGFKKVSKIRIQIVEESSVCTVKITAYGEALEHQQLRTIFTLFKTKKQDLECRNEMGIDLPLAAKLADLHGASIVVHSIPEIGNTFSVVFKKGSLHFQNN
tara:strand:- start:7749 stop:10592 length:2844 start_codon:yes stop_codon:yes gene_type:complete